MPGQSMEDPPVRTAALTILVVLVLGAIGALMKPYMAEVIGALMIGVMTTIPVTVFAVIMMLLSMLAGAFEKRHKSKMRVGTVVPARLVFTVCLSS